VDGKAAIVDIKPNKKNDSSPASSRHRPTDPVPRETTKGASPHKQQVVPSVLIVSENVDPASSDYYHAVERVAPDAEAAAAGDEDTPDADFEVEKATFQKTTTATSQSITTTKG
jgi:hypothetical protein